MKIRSDSPVAEPEYFFWMGNRLATDLLEISEDPSALDRPGFWAVSATFEGKWTCARFGRVSDSSFPGQLQTWSPIATEWKSSFSEDEYVHYVENIRSEIARGGVYQVNACRELSAQFTQPTLVGLMKHILQENPAPYASYLCLPGIEIASASPELFLQIEDGIAMSGPIKGTKSLAEKATDFGAKDVAENVMIVDLIRNDFGRICEAGSINVPHLLQEQVHPGLSHLVSFIRGKLLPKVSWVDISAAMMPPGSVSGAPKISALSAINANERNARGPYCGALGWVNGGDALLSVAIRIFWSNRDGYLRFGTGAGITWGSDPNKEWEETELKAARLLAIARGAV